MRTRRRVTWLLPLLWLAGCAFGPSQELKLSPTRFDAVPGWTGDDHTAALKSFGRSCLAILEQPSQAMVGSGKLRAPAAVWQDVCREAMDTEIGKAREFFETRFTPYVAEGGGLFTGYYEPLLYGSRKRHGRYQTPVYRLPFDVENGVPYYSRAEIERGALKKRHLELLYVSDPVMLFFAHIQGSAKVKIAGGGTIRIGYAGKNNHPYVSLGRVLKEMGELDEVNFFTLRDWLHDHPDRAKEVMQKNPSYVFFKQLPAYGGPIGAEGVPLTPERSLAVDARFIPYGMPLFMHTALPETAQAAAKPFNQLVIAQDTGGAIKGPVRGDIFFGSGARAEYLAGMMNDHGTYVVLVPNRIAFGI